jgi:hypothetical protein
VRQNAAAGEQAVAVVHVEVAAAVGKQLGDPAHLVAVLRHMRLHVETAGLLRVALQQTPAMASCASLLVAAKRGVTA